MKKLFMLMLVVLFAAQGCAVNIYKKNPKDKRQIEELSGEVMRLQDLMVAERKQFKETKRELEDEFRGEIKKKEMAFELGDRGLVIIVSDSILFNSGQAEIRSEAGDVLTRVVDIIKAKTPEKNIGIEGHTDNEPIKHSGWKSNWELSTSRATSVLHYLAKRGIKPSRLSATGYGEYRPIASNAMDSGRAKNRRVEIVILPEYTKKSIREIEDKRKEDQGWVK